MVLGAALTALALAAPIASAASLPSATVSSNLSGIANAKPSLRLGIQTGTGARITTVTIAVPPGLAFTTSAAGLARGVRTSGTGTAHSSVKGGLLTVTFRGDSDHVDLTVSRPALTESKGLKRAVDKVIDFNQAHHSDERDFPIDLTVTVYGAGTASVKVPIVIAVR
jgi:hypothetical protein